MLAKISRPTLAGEVQRERLFLLLDTRTVKPVTWLCAPGGSGKSTLVASYLDARKLPCLWYQCDEGDADPATFFYYMGLASKKAAPRFRKPLPLLTPEYLAGIRAFTRRYFETLFRRIVTPAGFFIVLDNYQAVPADAPLHEMVAIACEQLPDGGHLVVISRSGPPPALARLQANAKLGLVQESDIHFSPEETTELIHRRFPALDGERRRRIHENTRGWAAGIILMLEQGALNVAAGELPADFGHDGVFDYFAGEIFDKSAKEVQEFLLKTALLPTLNVPLAVKLTGIASAGRILATLNRHHFFTERLDGLGQRYQYHPLFRAFLLNRGRELFSAAALAALQSLAGQELEQVGQPEEAARLYCSAKNQSGLVRTVLGHARELLLQGRNRTLQEWLACLPAATLEATPWLLYWHGMSAFPVDLPNTRVRLMQALPRFAEVGDLSGCYLCWAGIVDTYVFTDEWTGLDGCILRFEELRSIHSDYPSPEIELVAATKMLLCLTLRSPDQPERIEKWLERVQVLLRKSPSPDLRIESLFCMSIHYLWTGAYEKNALLLERCEADVHHQQISPFARIRIKLMQGIHAWITADYAGARQTLAEGLGISAESGVHLYDPLLWSFCTAAELAPGRLVAAAAALRRQEQAVHGMESALNLFFLHVNRAWHLLLTGHPRRAAEHLESVADRVASLGTPYYHGLWHIGRAQIAHALGETEAARGHAETTRQLALEIKSPVLEWYALLIDAYVALQDGREAEGLGALRRGLALGRRHGYVHLEFYQPTVMRSLFARALAKGIEPEYVVGLIRKLSLTPPGDESPGAETCYLDAWPWPIKINTLGRFEILLDDQPLHFSGKEQKRPLELLKVIIACGGESIPEERLTDLLWPEADGDQARKSFETTLARLRRLLGSDEAIRCRGRLVSINCEICRVDSLVLGTLLDRSAQAPPERMAPLCARAVALHRGPFLAADGALPWAVAQREVLRNRLLRGLLKTGKEQEAQGAWEEATDTYARGIEADPLAEEFHRRLMTCQRHLGNHAEVVTLYQRCRALLKAELGIEPSPATTAVYTAILTPS